MLLKLKVKPGRLLIVWTDNTTTEAVVNKRKSGDHEVNEEWKTIQDLLISEQLDILAKRVCSADNQADGLSRGDRSLSNPKDIVTISIPSDLALVLEQIVEC
ncbi:hypothetical protein PTTG_10030 [Puccinia triticina 1-1 BBBD Race 1]|uniref:Reverse transcriptase RNase H-like domain-containing protein n=1 Tax=Puccinia triticina (isolate 1-1 / race 1 (BBBD)) TaxID=630390 RepID=A0A180G5F8_PUCT1|nr:hypothetical protein PTTG_10030 [Puccinia triticina 1-1 BBBD Race 1]